MRYLRKRLKLRRLMEMVKIQKSLVSLGWNQMRIKGYLLMFQRLIKEVS
jgi:hypothetical protein